MAVSYVWPGTLPQVVQEDFSETDGVLLLRTPMDAGPAKLRRRGQRPQTMSVSIWMTSAQVLILEDFVKNTIKGTARFGFPHPRTGAQVEARLVPSGEGTLYKTKYVSYDNWSIDLELEILP